MEDNGLTIILKADSGQKYLIIAGGSPSMASTISLEDIEKYAENVYEAIMIIAKRARQINDEQKRLMEIQLGPQEEVDDNYSDEPVNEIYEQSYVRLPKPTRIALEELLSGKLKCEYDVTEETQERRAEGEEGKKKK